MQRIVFLRLALFVLFLIAFVPFAAGKDNPEFTQFGRDIRIAPDQQTGDLTCVNCSVYIRGQVGGDVTTVHGNVIIEKEGSVAGDVTTFAGDARLDDRAKIGGDLTTFGGAVHRQPQAAVRGDVASLEGQGWVWLVFGAPFLFLAGIVAFVLWLVQRRPRPVASLAKAA
jgi:hypothetical protein